MKPVPEDWRARFRRSVTVLAGIGEMHDVLSARCDRAGLRDELVTMTDIASDHTCWRGARAWDLRSRCLCFAAKATGKEVKMERIARSRGII
jgi:hypothetical protein